MNGDPRPDLTRLQELLADQFTGGLAPDERDELEQLERQHGPEEAAAFERTAALIDLSLGPIEFEPLPTDLANRVRANAPRALPAPRPAAPVVFSLRRSREVLAWALAAACLLFAVTATMNQTGQRPQPGLAEQRAALLRDAPDAITIPWSAATDPTGQGAGGDLVWSNRDQRGYMRFHGLKGNDPSKDQYQLWIFDTNQDEHYPIDGGVFDVDKVTGDVIVPIRPKIRVGRPTLFAITVEKPGGVVVSKRDRLALIAKVPTS
jgi:anti-sigma-K factor RskA